jgi:DNA-directed RNA polymerase sigma subunit (sigma70/sigma32)
MEKYNPEYPTMRGVHLLISLYGIERRPEIEALSPKQVDQAVSRVCSILTNEGRDVIQKRYGLNTPAPLTIVETGKSLRMADSEVMQAEVEARERARLLGQILPN